MNFWDLKDEVKKDELQREYLFLRIIKDSKDYLREIETTFSKEEIEALLKMSDGKKFVHEYAKTRFDFLKWRYLGDDSGFEKIKWGVNGLRRAI